MKKETQVILVSKSDAIPTKSDSYSAGAYYHRLEFLEPDTGAIYHTYVDKKMKNYAAWSSIIESDEYHGLYDGFKLKRDELISADSRPRKLLHLDKDEIIQAVEFLLTPPETTFQRLFEFKAKQ